LRAAGYVTASVVASPFAGRLTGLQRGFDYMSEWAVVQQRQTDAEGRDRFGGTRDSMADVATILTVLSTWLNQRHFDAPFAEMPANSILGVPLA